MATHGTTVLNTLNIKNKEKRSNNKCIDDELEHQLYTEYLSIEQLEQENMKNQFD